MRVLSEQFSDRCSYLSEHCSKMYFRAQRLPAVKYLLIHDDMKRIAELHDQLLKADPHARLYAAATPEAVDKIVGEHHLSLAFVSLRL